MYKVTCKQYNSDTVYTLHNPKSQELKLSEPKLELEENKSGTFTFKMLKTHPYYDKVLKMGCEISVFRDDTIIYIGRPLSDEEDFYGTKSVTCEGILAYLLDSIQRPYSHQGTIKSFFNKMIDNHNAMVDDFKKFTIGTVDVVDSNNYINRSTSDYTNTLQAINDKLIDTHGGYLKIDYDTRTINYLQSSGGESSQIIRSGDNLLDLSRYIKSDDLITAVIPLGAETEEEGFNDTKLKLTIESVNGGKDYLLDSEAVKEFGIIFGTVEFDEVTLPENLKRKGQEYLDKSKNLSLTIELSAVDLSVIDVDIEKFTLGEQVRVVSQPHSLDSYFMLSKLEIDLSSPANNKITLGKTKSTLTSDITQKQNETALKIIKQQEQLSIDMYNAIDNATNLITGGQGGYLRFAVSEDGQPQELYILDQPSIEDAKNVIRLNKNGLGFSNNGYNGTFTNAWTIDGQLVADFITTGTINADLIKTGKIVGKKNTSIYFDLDNGIMSGSLLVDPNSTITAEFAQRYYDGDYYRGLILYDKKDSSSDNTQIGGISRAWYTTDTDTPSITFYGNDNVYFQSHGIGNRNNVLGMEKVNGVGRIFLNRAIGENEEPAATQEQILWAGEEELYFKKYIGQADTFGYLYFYDKGAYIGYQQMLSGHPTTKRNYVWIEPPNTDGTTTEIKFIVNDVIVGGANKDGLYSYGVQLNEKISELEERISKLENQ